MKTWHRISSCALLSFLALGCSSAPGDESEPSQDALRSCPSGQCQPVCGFDGLDYAMSHGGLYSDPGGGSPSRNLPTPVPDGKPDTTYHVAQYTASCPMSDATDELSVAQRTLIQTYGCSSPFYFEAYNSNLSTPATDPQNGTYCVVGVDPWACWTDKANGYPQLCPYSTALQSYVNAITILHRWDGQPSDTLAHFAGDARTPADSAAGFTRQFPHPAPQQGATPSSPSGYVWVIPWQDPHACAGGCMCAI